MTYYPVWQQGGRVTAGLLLKGQTQVVYKQQNTYRVTDVFQIDPELQMELEANATYWVEFYIRSAAIASSRAMRTQWATPTGSTGLKEAQGADQGVTLDSTTGGGTPRMGVHQFATTVGYGSRGLNNTLQASYIERGAITTGGGPGTLGLVWAQITTDASDTLVAAGSMLTVRRIG